MDTRACVVAQSASVVAVERNVLLSVVSGTLARHLPYEFGFVPDGFGERVEYLASLMDTDIDAGNVRGQFFIARDIPADALMITEGSLLIVKPSELAQMEHKLTPSARFAMKAYLCKRRFA